MKFEALPGPGHYQEFQVPKKKQNSSFISSTSRYSNPRSRPSMLRPNIDELSITSTVDDSKLRLFSSDNIEHNNSPKKKRLIRTRNNPSLSHSKTAISIPFKKEDDNSNSVGPGYYEPNISAVHKKVPYTKIMKDTLHNRQGNINFVRRIVKTMSKPKNPAVHEQIATHKLDNENAVFSSRTSRNPDIKPTPGPGLYNSEFDHTYVKNLPEGFGSTTEREYLMNRNIFEAPFSDPTSTFNPGVGTYNRRRKHRKEHPENKIKKMQDSLNQNRAMTLANAKLLNKDRSINESKNQKADPPGPGQYDCGFREELKMLDHKLSARYKKVPFGSSSKRFKLEKCQENIKKNRKITLRNTNFNTSNDTNESILQQKKNRNKQVTERIKQINKVKPSHMFKSQSQRLENPKKNYHSSERRFQADVLKNNIFSSKAHKEKLNKTNSCILLKPPIFYGSQKCGFNILSPRFTRSKSKFSPGPGEYLKSPLNPPPNPFQPPNLFGTSPRLSPSHRLNSLPHSYTTHKSMVKKSYPNPHSLKRVSLGKEGVGREKGRRGLG